MPVGIPDVATPLAVLLMLNSPQRSSNDEDNFDIAFFAWFSVGAPSLKHTLVQKLKISL
jgi:hypothetical protein